MGNHRLTFTEWPKSVKGGTLNSNCHETPAETRFAGDRESDHKRDQVKGRIYLDVADVSKEISFRIRGSKETVVVPTWPNLIFHRVPSGFRSNPITKTWTPGYWLVFPSDFSLFLLFSFSTLDWHPLPPSSFQFAFVNFVRRLRPGKFQLCPRRQFCDSGAGSQFPLATRSRVAGHDPWNFTGIPRETPALRSNVLTLVGAGDSQLRSLAARPLRPLSPAGNFDRFAFGYGTAPRWFRSAILGERIIAVTNPRAFLTFYSLGTVREETGSTPSRMIISPICQVASRGFQIKWIFVDLCFIIFGEAGFQFVKLIADRSRPQFSQQTLVIRTCCVVSNVICICYSFVSSLKSWNWKFNLLFLQILSRV